MPEGVALMTYPSLRRQARGFGNDDLSLFETTDQVLRIQEGKKVVLAVVGSDSQQTKLQFIFTIQCFLPGADAV